MRFIPHTDDDVRGMLAAIGAPSVASLFECVPEKLRLGRALALPAAGSEQEVLAELAGLAEQNTHAASHAWFLGAGTYAHFVPVRRRRARLARRVLHRVHALPGRDQPGNAPDHLRVADDDGRADRPRRVERVDVRRRVGDRGGRADGAPHHAAPEGRGERRAPSALPRRPRDLPRRARRGDRRDSARRGRPDRRRGTRSRDRVRDPPAAELPRLRRGPRGGGRRRARERRAPRLRHDRGALARAPARARRLRRRHRVRRGAELRGADVVRRPARRLPLHAHGERAPAAGTPRRADRGRARQARLRPHALDARAAHPARARDVEHLHEPGALPADGDDLPLALRAPRPARARGAQPREGAVREDAAGRGRRGAALRRADVQRVRDRGAGRRGGRARPRARARDRRGPRSRALRARSRSRAPRLRDRAGAARADRRARGSRGGRA